MTGHKLSAESRERIATMVRTNNGFEIAEADLRLRGPGDLQGTQQSGIVQLAIADLSQDSAILQTARMVAEKILENDPLLEEPGHEPMRRFIQKQQKSWEGWSRIS